MVMSLKEYKDAKSIKKLVEKMFEVRQTSHNVHLQTKSYSTHKALNSYYSDILELTDNFVETWQGQYGILTGYENIQVTPIEDIVSYLEDAAKIFMTGRDSLKETDSHLKNILDELVSTTYSTLYKLKYLK
jgi:hypothetical protein